MIVLTNQDDSVIHEHSRKISFWIKQWQDVLTTNQCGLRFTKHSLSDRYKENQEQFKVCHYQFPNN